MQNWTCIFTTKNLQEAEITKGLLTYNGINSVIINKQDSSYMFGDYELYVSREDSERATRIIQEHSSGKDMPDHQ